MVAFTVERIFNCVPIVGILSQACRRFWKFMRIIKHYNRMGWREGGGGNSDIDKLEEIDKRR